MMVEMLDKSKRTKFSTKYGSKHSANKKKSAEIAAEFQHHLQRYRQLRHHNDAEEGFRQHYYFVQEWQAARMRKTHAELLEDKQYRIATEFFLTDIYGSVDLRELANQIERAVNKALRILPEKVMTTAACALEFNALSAELDEKLTQFLFSRENANKFAHDYSTVPLDALADVMNADDYCFALKSSSTLQERRQQADLAKQLAQGMDSYVRSKVLYATFKLLKKPAHKAGVGVLYEFMSKGFAALNPMGSASEIVSRIVEREYSLAERAFAGEQPYESFSLSDIKA